jgi:integrase
MATVKKRAWTTATGEKREAFRVAYTDRDGKRQFKQFPLKRDADAYRVKCEAELLHGIHTPEAKSVTVAEAANVWLASCEAGGCDRGTLKTYREIANHVTAELGSEKLSRLSAPRVVEFRDKMMLTRSHPMAAKAVRHLSMILGEAMRRGLVAQNVARAVKVKRPRGDMQKLAKRAETPPQTHLRAMIEAADRLANEDPRLPVMLRVVMLAGLRASEVRGFAWSSADLRAPSLSVTQRADRWSEIGAPKSNAGHRTIPIGPGLASALKAWKLRCPPSELNLMFPNRPKGRQWPSSAGQTGGGPIKQHTMAALLLKVQVEAGIAIDTGRTDPKGRTVWALRYDWHHLRHVAASNWLNDGIDLKRLQTWIGHENIQLTIDVYGHLIVDARKDAALAAGAEAALLG